MLSFMEKLSKIFRRLSIIAVILSAILLILSYMDLSFLFEHKAVYYSGIYTINGYVSPFLEYRFTTPNGATLSRLEERASILNINVTGLTEEQIEEKFSELSTVIDLMVTMPSGSNAMAYVILDPKAKEKNLEIFVEDFIEQAQINGYNISNNYNITNYLGKKCGKCNFSTYLDGVKVLGECYFFVENGYVWSIAFSYTEGLESEKEKLYNAFTQYE